MTIATVSMAAGFYLCARGKAMRRSERRAGDFLLRYPSQEPKAETCEIQDPSRQARDLPEPTFAHCRVLANSNYN